MKFTIVTDPRAEKELKEAYLWYEEKVSGLGDRFLTQVEKALSVIIINPEMYPKKKGNYRTLQIKIFPYVVIYEVFKKDSTLLLLSVFHGKRNPKRKYKK